MNNEDAISRKGTVEAIVRRLGIKDISYLMPSEKALVDVINSMPPVEQTRKTCVMRPLAKTLVECSHCGCAMDDIQVEGFDYCPYCGYEIER